MKKVLFATTATGALLIGGIASAQGIALFGDARLGLGYNINNEGGVLTDRRRRRVRHARRSAGGLARPVRRQHDRRDRQRHHLRRHDPRGQLVGRPGRPERPDRRQRLRVGQLRHPDLRRHQRRRRAVGRRRPGRLLADRPQRPRRDAVHLERRQLRQATAAAASPTTRSPARRSATTSTSWASACRCRRTAT